MEAVPPAAAEVRGRRIRSVDGTALPEPPATAPAPSRSSDALLLALDHGLFTAAAPALALAAPSPSTVEARRLKLEAELRSLDDMLRTERATGRDVERSLRLIRDQQKAKAARDRLIQRDFRCAEVAARSLELERIQKRAAAVAEERRAVALFAEELSKPDELAAPHAVAAKRLRRDELREAERRGRLDVIAQGRKGLEAEQERLSFEVTALQAKGTDYQRLAAASTPRRSELAFFGASSNLDAEETEEEASLRVMLLARPIADQISPRSGTQGYVEDAMFDDAPVASAPAAAEAAWAAPAALSAEQMFIQAKELLAGEGEGALARERVREAEEAVSKAATDAKWSSEGPWGSLLPEDADRIASIDVAAVAEERAKADARVKHLERLVSAAAFRDALEESVAAELEALWAVVNETVEAELAALAAQQLDAWRSARSAVRGALGLEVEEAPALRGPVDDAKDADRLRQQWLGARPSARSLVFNGAVFDKVTAVDVSARSSAAGDATVLVAAGNVAGVIGLWVYAGARPTPAASEEGGGESKGEDSESKGESKGEYTVKKDEYTVKKGDDDLFASTATEVLGAAVVSLSFSDQGKGLVAVDADGCVRVWRIVEPLSCLLEAMVDAEAINAHVLISCGADRPLAALSTNLKVVRACFDAFSADVSKGQPTVLLLSTASGAVLRWGCDFAPPPMPPPRKKKKKQKSIFAAFRQRDETEPEAESAPRSVSQPRAADKAHELLHFHAEAALCFACKEERVSVDESGNIAWWTTTDSLRPSSRPHWIRRRPFSTSAVRLRPGVDWADYQVVYDRLETPAMGPLFDRLVSQLDALQGSVSQPVQRYASLSQPGVTLVVSRNAAGHVETLASQRPAVAAWSRLVDSAAVPRRGPGADVVACVTGPVGRNRNANVLQAGSGLLTVVSMSRFAAAGRDVAAIVVREDTPVDACACAATGFCVYLRVQKVVHVYALHPQHAGRLRTLVFPFLRRNTKVVLKALDDAAAGASILVIADEDGLSLVDLLHVAPM
ncbi:hypothetical protein M885DRAFT_521670 [Pelagophyceae sp. CCMP2097]|nr:hypothetical protein M885DRAFT_521670 [Pelagophyceae sp. CCMP2097]